MGHVSVVGRADLPFRGNKLNALQAHPATNKLESTIKPLKAVLSEDREAASGRTEIKGQRMFGNNQQPGGQRGGPGDDLKGGFATVAALMLAMIFAPTLSELTLPFVVGIARRSYPPDIVSLFETAWMVLAFPLTFFAARAGIAYALTAAGVYLAYRFI